MKYRIVKKNRLRQPEPYYIIQKRIGIFWKICGYYDIDTLGMPWVHYKFDNKEEAERLVHAWIKNTTKRKRKEFKKVFEVVEEIE